MNATFSPFCHFIFEGKPKSFGLTYLKPRRKAMFDEAFRLYEQCCYLFMGLSGMSLQQHQLKLLNAQEILKKTDTSFKTLQAVKSDINTYSADYMKLKQMIAYQKQSLRLQDQGVWENWHQQLTTPSSQTKLKLLQAEWLRHGKYAHFPCAALWYAHDLLAEFSIHQQYALKELHRSFWLPQSVKNNYKNYLIAWRNQIEAERIKLQWAMLARLKRSLDSCLRDTDLVLNLQQQLTKLSVSHKLNSLPKTTIYDSSAEEMKKLFHYLHTHGIPDVKAQLSELNCLQATQNLVLTMISSKKEIFFVPQTIRQFIPKESKRPRFLFKGHHQRYDFFRNKTELLLKLQTLPELKLTAINSQQPLLDPTWQQLIHIDLSLQTVADEINQQFPKGFIKLFRDETAAFYQECDKLIAEQTLVLLNRELEFAKQWLPKTEPLEKLLEDPIFSLEQRYDLIHLIDHIQQRLDYLKQSNLAIVYDTHITLLQSNINDAKQQLNALLAFDDNIFKMRAEYKEARRYLFAIINHQTNSSNTQLSLLAYYRQLSNKKKADFKKRHESDFINLKRELITCIQESFTLLHEGNSESLAKINQNLLTFDLLKELGVLIADTEWNDAMGQLMASYKQFVLSLTSERISEQADLLTHFEEVLAQIFTGKAYTELKAIQIRHEQIAIAQEIITKNKDKTAEITASQQAFLKDIDSQIQQTYTYVDEAQKCLNRLTPDHSKAMGWMMIQQEIQTIKDAQVELSTTENVNAHKNPQQSSTENCFGEINTLLASSDEEMTSTYSLLKKTLSYLPRKVGNNTSASVYTLATHAVYPSDRIITKNESINNSDNEAVSLLPDKRTFSN